MAVIRAVFRLDDQASATMAKIAAKAELLDKQLNRLSSTTQRLDSDSSHFTTSWEKKMDRMRNATNTAASDINTDLKGVSDRLTKMSQHKYKIRVDADTTLAHNKLGRLSASARRTILGRAMGEADSGGLSGKLGDKAESAKTARAKQMYQALSRSIDSLGNTFDRVGVNLGPFSARLSALPALLALIGPPVIGAISAALTTLAGVISAVGAAAVGAAGLLGAFAAGIASIAVPVVYAAKQIKEKNKAVDKYKKALDKAKESLARTKKTTKDGTAASAAYTNAVYRHNKALKDYRDALSKLSGPERSAITNVQALKKDWEALVIKGPSGQRAMSIVNSALIFARTQLPVMAKQMDRFTLVADRMFKKMIRNAPAFRKNLESMMQTWPQRFEELGTATGNVTNALVGVMRAAAPLMEWMSKGILDASRRFNKFANSPAGQKKMQKFFDDMKPIIKEVIGLIGDIASAIFKMGTSKSGKKDTLYFLHEMRDIVQKSPGYIIRMSRAFRKMWPEIKAFGKGALKFFEAMAPLVETIFWFLGKITNLLLKLPTGAIQAITIMAVALRFSPARAAVWWSISKAWKAMAWSAKSIMGTGFLKGLGRGAAGAGAARGAAGAGAAGAGAAAGGAAAAGLAAAIAPVAAIVIGTAVVGVAAYALWKFIMNRNRGKDHRPSEITRALEKKGYKKSDPIYFDKKGRLLSAEESRRIKKSSNFPDREYGPTNSAAKRQTLADQRAIAASGSDALEKSFRNLQTRLNAKFSFDVIHGTLRSITKSMDSVETQKFIRSKSGVKMMQQIDTATSRAMKKGKANISVNGEQWVLEYDKIARTMSAKRIKTDKLLDTGGFFSDINSVTSAVGNLFAKVGMKSPMQPPKEYGAPYKPGYGTNKADGGMNFGQAEPPGPKPKSKPGQGDGFGIATGLMSSLFPKPKGALKTRGILRPIASSAKEKTWQSAMKKAQDFLASSMGNTKGLLPGVASMAALLARRFGLTMGSGFRANAITEFGNPSLHSFGKAVDLSGSASNMQALFNFLQGKSGVQELIYNGRASYNGGPVVPFTGRDKHTDHVHVGFGTGDGYGQPSGKGRGVTVTFTGDVHINDGSSYQEFASKLASEIERATKSMTNTTASEMIQ